MKRFRDTANTALRMDMIAIGILILFLILTLRLTYLGLSKGDEYRKVADEKRLRKIFETPPRGEIRDRNGRLLAGNIPSFTAQILKDELMNMNVDPKERNSNLLTLIRLLEEDGAFYQGDFPLDLNVYVFDSKERYLEAEETPSETMVTKLMNEEVLRSFMESSLNLDRYPGHYSFSVKSRALNAAREKYVDLPVRLEEGMFVEDGGRLGIFLKDKDLPENTTAEELVFHIVQSDRAIVRKILNHPIARAILFDILAQRQELGPMRMKAVASTYEIEGFEQRVSLVKRFPALTLDTTAEDAFLYLGTTHALEQILRKAYDGEGEKKIIPGEMLLKKLQAKDKLLSMEIYLSEDETLVFYSLHEEAEEVDPLKVLIATLTPEDVREFILQDEIRPLIQRELLTQNINPHISVAHEIAYAADLKENNLYLRYFSAKEMEEDPTAEDLLQRYREEYGLDPSLSNYEAKGILSIYDLALKQGERAYRPVNLSYGLKPKTVAKLEEQIPEGMGIRVSIEPVRYYPMGKNSCHVLGYIGKISTEKEVEYYVGEKKYDRNEFIGKTGLEESFEADLRGKGGEQIVEVDYMGNTTNKISEIKSIPGHTVYTTIDAKYQAMLEEMLQRTIELNRVGGVWESPWGDYKMDIDPSKKRPYIHCNAGAVVALNAKTGEVLAMASYPGYDPNLFSTGISATDWKNYFPEDDSDPLAARPLYNIATQTAVQPGSTFKMVTGYAALQKGLDPYEKIYDKGFVEVGNQKYRCLIYTMFGGSHGNVDLSKALEQSCNYYFYSLVLGENQQLNHKPISAKVEIEDVIKACEDFGLNSPTGIEINIPRETVGGVPQPEKKVVTTRFYMRKYLEKNLPDFENPGRREKKTKEDFDHDIAVITGWAEEGRSLSKNEIISRLEDLGYIGEGTVSGHSRSLSDVLKYDYINQAGWTIGDTLLVSIGQGASHFTTVQMANYIATLANGGHRNKVTLINSIKTADNTKEVYAMDNRSVDLDIKNPDGFAQLRKGMKLVSESGTSRRAFLNFPIATGSKTGTAQRAGINPTTGQPYDDFAWYVSFAPYDDPEIVIAAVLFQGGTGSNAAPMARDLMAEYLGLNRKEVTNIMPFTNRIAE
ncbi:MAG: penicillin-binding transpeptidase domain-containing protein [Tissierellia bacterium]|nr:penicillin-binding transpeptidase domain-containing protein [Tissierellia bacterium]